MQRKITILIAILLLFTISFQGQTVKSKGTSKQKIFIVLDITVNDSIMYEQYRINVEPIIKKMAENI